LAPKPFRPSLMPPGGWLVTDRRAVQGEDLLGPCGLHDLAGRDEGLDDHALVLAAQRVADAWASIAGDGDPAGRTIPRRHATDAKVRESPHQVSVVIRRPPGQGARAQSGMDRNRLE